jgi:1,4-alpha-glucan branching enzyme
MSNELTNSPTVMQDFVFGALESDANTLAAERQRWSGIRHHYTIDPLDPQPDYRCFFTDAAMSQFTHDHPEARRYLLDAAHCWLREFGVDGYRLDYAAGPRHDLLLAQRQ